MNTVVPPDMKLNVHYSERDAVRMDRRHLTLLLSLGLLLLVPTASACSLEVPSLSARTTSTLVVLDQSGELLREDWVYLGGHSRAEVAASGGLVWVAHGETLELFTRNGSQGSWPIEPWLDVEFSAESQGPFIWTQGLFTWSEPGPRLLGPNGPSEVPSWAVGREWTPAASYTANPCDSGRVSIWSHNMTTVGVSLERESATVISATGPMAELVSEATYVNAGGLNLSNATWSLRVGEPDSIPRFEHSGAVDVQIGIWMLHASAQRAPAVVRVEANGSQMLLAPDENWIAPPWEWSAVPTDDAGVIDNGTVVTEEGDVISTHGWLEHKDLRGWGVSDGLLVVLLVESVDDGLPELNVPAGSVLLPLLALVGALTVRRRPR